MQWFHRLKANYGMDPWIWQSLDGPSFRLSSELCLCNSFHGHFVPHSKKEGSIHTLDSILLLGMGNKIPMEGVTETKFGAETEGMTIQRLPHLGIHPINNHQTQSLGRCQQEPADRTLIQLSPAKLCQFMANKDVDDHKLNKAQGPQ